MSWILVWTVKGWLTVNDTFTSECHCQAVVKFTSLFHAAFHAALTLSENVKSLPVIARAIAIFRTIYASDCATAHVVIAIAM